jgi:demethylmenaquinone methyltransferase/2-methoxy-6-polyprenyl-1,4-benzoquinol methylase
MMSPYEHDSVLPLAGSDQAKKQQVAEMFNRIAFRYDFLNRFLSGGLDVYWRKRAIRELGLPVPGNILDVATGTGDLAIRAARLFPTQQITGVDISEAMLALGRKKIIRQNLQHRIDLISGDSESLPFGEATFGAVMVAFGVRNFGDLEAGLREMRRVIRPSGRLVVLEFSKPSGALFNRLCRFYISFVAPRIGKLISRQEDAYAYLNKSIRAFPEGRDFLDILIKTGFASVYLKPLSQGICTIYIGSRPAQ